MKKKSVRIAALGAILLVLLLGCHTMEAVPDDNPPNSTAGAVKPIENMTSPSPPIPTQLEREVGRFPVVGMDSSLSYTDQRVLLEDGALTYLDAERMEGQPTALDLVLIHYQTIAANEEIAMSFLQNQAYSKHPDIKTSNVFVYVDNTSALDDKGWFAGNGPLPSVSNGYVEVVWVDGALCLGENILPEGNPLEYFLELNGDDAKDTSDLSGLTGIIQDAEVSVHGITPGMSFPQTLGCIVQSLSADPDIVLTIGTDMGLHLGDSYISFHPSAGLHYVSYVLQRGSDVFFRGHTSLVQIMESIGISEFSPVHKGALKEVYRGDSGSCELYYYDCFQLCAETTGGLKLNLIFDAKGRLISLKSAKVPVRSEEEQLRVRQAIQGELSDGRWTLADAEVISITYESIYLELSSDDSDTRKIIDIPNSFDYTAALTEILLTEATPNLRRLELDYFPYGDISFLADYRGLYLLQIGGGDIRTLEPLSRLHSLERLYLNRQNISDASPLAELKMLTDVELDGNYICDASTLRDMAVYGPLSYLNLDDNPLTDIGQPFGLVEGSTYLLAPDGSQHYYIDISFKNTPFEEYSLFYDFLD